MKNKIIYLLLFLLLFVFINTSCFAYDFVFSDDTFSIDDELFANLNAGLGYRLSDIKYYLIRNQYDTLYFYVSFDDNIKPFYSYTSEGLSICSFFDISTHKNKTYYSFELSSDGSLTPLASSTGTFRCS